MSIETKYKILRPDVLYPELSFIIVGVLFSVYGELGGGLTEKIYQRAVAVGLTQKGIQFREQHYVPLNFQRKNIGKQYLDFIIEEKVILELKRGKYAPMAIINQTKQYLEILGLELAIIGCFTNDGVVQKRIINQTSK